MKSSIRYTINGDFKHISLKFDNEFYFQKDLDLNKQEHLIELEIAKKLQKNDIDNCVKILDIQIYPNCHIKYELLDTSKDYDKNIYSDIKNGLKNLHKENIIYIDLKNDNIGYCYKSKKWKLFDFDCCGITNNKLTNWLIEPPRNFMHHEINLLKDNIEEYFTRNKIKNIPISNINKLKKIKETSLLNYYDKFAYFLWCKKIM